MIRAIVAMDPKQGIADASGIPWRLPADHSYFRKMTINSSVLMGYNTYLTRIIPLQKRRNYVICEAESVLRDGFEPVYDVDVFLSAKRTDDLWIIGGAETFTHCLRYCQELYITQIAYDFHCSKYFPEFKDQFELVRESDQQTDSNIAFIYQVWRRK